MDVNATAIVSPCAPPIFSKKLSRISCNRSLRSSFSPKTSLS